jgi:hypothetical protein
MPAHVEIDFQLLRRPADIGVARASVFLGLTTNAAAAKPPLSHVLDDKVQYRFIPDDVPPEASAHFMEEFTYWIIGNALRELVDAFSAFLIECRPVLHIMATKQIAEDGLSKLKATIENKNICQQYEEIQELVGLDPLYAEMFETFRQARNCLAHRRGVVAQRDVNTDNQYFKLRWCFMGIYLQDLESGIEQLIDHDAINVGVKVGKGGGTVVSRLTWKEKKFSIGSQIKLNQHNLAQICFGVHLATCHVVTKLHEFALAHGIPDAELENVAEATAELPQIVDVLDNLDRGD